MVEEWAARESRPQRTTTCGMWANRGAAPQHRNWVICPFCEEDGGGGKRGRWGSSSLQTKESESGTTSVELGVSSQYFSAAVFPHDSLPWSRRGPGSGEHVIHWASQGETEGHLQFPHCFNCHRHKLYGLQQQGGPFETFSACICVA